MPKTHKSLRELGAELTVSHQSLFRHRKNCMYGLGQVAHQDPDLALVVTLRNSMKTLKYSIDQLLKGENQAPDQLDRLKAMTGLMSELRQTVKVLLEMRSISGPRPDDDIRQQFQDFKATVLQVLGEYPDAKAKLIDKIREMVKA